MERETKWIKIEDPEKIVPYLPTQHREQAIDVALVRILQYTSATEFSQLLQITYKMQGESKFNFTKHRIKHDVEEREIRKIFPGIQTYIKFC